MHRDKIMALNVPRRVEVEFGADGLPVLVGSQVVESVGETWRIDDEWWRRSISRRYIEAILEGGKHVVLFEDVTTGEWYMQKP